MLVPSVGTKCENLNARFISTESFIVIGLKYVSYSDLWWVREKDNLDKFPGC